MYKNNEMKVLKKEAQKSRLPCELINSLRELNKAIT